MIGTTILLSSISAYLSGCSTSTQQATLKRKMRMSEKGTVKKVYLKKRFGFIERENGPDLFFSFSQIQGEEETPPEYGDKVEFDVVYLPGGIQEAQNVVIKR